MRGGRPGSVGLPRRASCTDSLAFSGARRRGSRERIGLEGQGESKVVVRIPLNGSCSRSQASRSSLSVMKIAVEWASSSPECRGADHKRGIEHIATERHRRRFHRFERSLVLVTLRAAAAAIRPANAQPRVADRQRVVAQPTGASIARRQPDCGRGACACSARSRADYFPG